MVSWESLAFVGLDLEMVEVPCLRVLDLENFGMVEYSEEEGNPSAVG